MMVESANYHGALKFNEKQNYRKTRVKKVEKSLWFDGKSSKAKGSGPNARTLNTCFVCVEFTGANHFTLIGFHLVISMLAVVMVFFLTCLRHFHFHTNFKAQFNADFVEFIFRFAGFRCRSQNPSQSVVVTVRSGTFPYILLQQVFVFNLILSFLSLPLLRLHVQLHGCK